ncbi:MAG TPA: SdpI family protein [Chitinophagales bacterium]|nr:SdpI family protein [Chitinophagales bacterium]
MKNINWKKEIVIWTLLLVPFIYSMIVWNKISDQVPTHFNIKGEPDDYSSKPFALLLLPAMNIFIYFVLFFIPRIDPRKKNYESFGSSYQNIRLVIHLFFVGIFIYITQTTSGGQALHLNAFISGMLLFFALLGNYMRTMRSNWFVGIRTPWTLSNDIVWRKTHELGGRIWFYSGLVLAVVVFFLPEVVASITMGIGIFVMVIIPVVYSYFEYRKITQVQGEEHTSRQ